MHYALFNEWFYKYLYYVRQLNNIDIRQQVYIMYNAIQYVYLLQVAAIIHVNDFSTYRRQII